MGGRARHPVYDHCVHGAFLCVRHDHGGADGHVHALVVDVQLDSALQEKVQAKEQAKQDAEIAELEKQTAQAQAETNQVIAESEANIKRIEAQAEADANAIISQSITPELIQMKEAEARLEHGWITVQGADTVVTNGG